MPSGLDRAEWQPGSLVFCHGRGFISWVIRTMQAVRSPRADAHWNHVAILEKKEGVEWWVIQAEGKGVIRAPLTHVAPGGTYEVIRCPGTPNRVVEFASSQVGKKYGFLTIASIIVNVITPKRIGLRKPGTWICSALAAGSLWYGGWPESQWWDDIYQVSPADLYSKL